MPRNSTSMTAGTRIVADNRRSASAASKAWLGAVLQTVREGSAVAVETLLADLRADGHVISAAEADMIDDVERYADNKLDTEIDLCDEDDARIEAWDEATGTQEVAASARGNEPFESEVSPVVSAGYQIIVDGDVCRLHLPTWAGFESRTELGQQILDELGNRFVVLERIARWLSESRKQFLVSADPWHVGCDAFNEFRRGHVPVSPQSFLEVTGIGKLAKPEAFSRYTRDCWLVWPDATAPLTILFDTRARQAWVGNVIKQMADTQGRTLSAADLNEFRVVTKPRTKIQKQDLQFASVDSLSFPEVLIRAVTIANVGLSGVLAQYGERITVRKNE